MDVLHDPHVAREIARAHDGDEAAVNERLIDELARRITARRLETPAVFLLEMNKPFAFLLGQGLLFGAPLLGAFFGFRRVERWARLLEDPDAYERLLVRIEQLAARADGEESRDAEAGR